MKILTQKDIEICAEILRNDGVIAFPTETVYGLGIKATSKENYDKLVKIKNRPSDKPFTLMCSSVDDFKNIVEINEWTRKIIVKFMPGPITLILKVKTEVPEYIDLGTGFVGVRIPDDDFVRNMIKKVGAPLLVPSANISSFPPAKTYQEVIRYFHDNLDAVVKGKCESNVPSAIFKIYDENIIQIRPGEIKLSELVEVVK